MIIKRINPAEFPEDALDSFNRHQMVTNVYRHTQGGTAPGHCIFLPVLPRKPSIFIALWGAKSAGIP